MRRIGGAETSRNVLVDFKNVYYRAYYSYVIGAHREGIPLFEQHSGLNLRLIFGFIELLSTWLHEIENPTRIILFLDGSPSRRIALDPLYKQDRRSTNKTKEGDPPLNTAASFTFPDGMVVSGEIEFLTKILRLCGCDAYYGSGEESDDLIASFVKKNPGEVHVIVSDDKDFFQLVEGRTVVFRPGSKSKKFLDAEGVASCMLDLYKIPVPPKHIRMFKTLTGDSSDGIVGIHRLRKKNAVALFECPDLEAVFASGLPGLSEREKLTTHATRERLELNYKLVSFYDDIDLDPYSLPRHVTPDGPKTAKNILFENWSLPWMDLPRCGHVPASADVRVPIADWLL